MKTSIAAILSALLLLAQPSNAQGTEAVFKDTLSLWVASAVRLDVCTFKSNSEKDIETVVNAAADAFYPGFFSWWSRSDFRDDLMLKVAVARLTGHADAQTKGCFGVDLIERTGRQVIDQMIDQTARAN